MFKKWRMKILYWVYYHVIGNRKLSDAYMLLKKYDRKRLGLQLGRSYNLIKLGLETEEEEVVTSNNLSAIIIRLLEVYTGKHIGPYNKEALNNLVIEKLGCTSIKYLDDDQYMKIFVENREYTLGETPAYVDDELWEKLLLATAVFHETNKEGD